MPNLFPAGVENLSATTQPSNRVEFGRSWRFDFDAGEFVLTPTGKVAAVENVAAWMEWCRKALRTARYKHLIIYSRDYGQELDDLVGLALSRAAAESEIKRMARECLMADPRTAAVSNFTFSWEDGTVHFTCDIANVLGESATIDGSAVIS